MNINAYKSLPPSPNWFLSHTSDANEEGIYVYAARNSIYVFDVSVPSAGPKMLGSLTCDSDRITAVALSPAGAADDGSGDPAAGNLVPSSEVPELAVRSYEKRLTEGWLCCSGSDDKTVRIWTLHDFTTLQLHMEHKEKVTAVCWSPINASLIASGDEKGEVIVWNRKLKSVMRWRQEKDHIYCTAFCPHAAALLAVGVRMGTVFLVDFSSGSSELVHRLRGHDDEVHSLSWCPVPGEALLTNAQDDPGDDTGCLIATGSKDRTIRIWSCSQGKQLLVKKVIQTKGRRKMSDDSGRPKGWMAVLWLKYNPHQLVSSSAGSDLLLWTLKSDSTMGHAGKCRSFYRAEFQPHHRLIFNISAAGKHGEMLCTLSQDRNIILWSVEDVQAVCSLPTLGGYVYAIRSSPLDPGRVAVGVGDNMIRVWNSSNKTDPYDVHTLWQGIKSKVTTIAWHPQKEGLLAFGTDDGRVGVVDVLSSRSSMPVMSSTFHRRTVYVVTWGHASSALAGTGGQYSLYSLGDLKVLEHTVGARTEAVDFTAMLCQANNDHLSGLKATELSWHLQQQVLALGTDDGSVYVFAAPGLMLLASIKIHTKLINCLRWHPQVTEESLAGSPCRNWLVSGGNDSTLHVVDLSAVLAAAGQDSGCEVALITSSMRQFTGHSQRVTDISWSPHCDGRLVSVSYDAQAFVWDVQQNKILAEFRGHLGRILSCQFSGLDPDLVMSGGSDSSLLVWRISEQMPQSGEKKKRKRKVAHAKPRHPVPQSGDISEDRTALTDVSDSGAQLSEMTDLKALLEKRRQALLAEAVSSHAGQEDAGDTVARDDARLEDGGDSASADRTLRQKSVQVEEKVARGDSTPYEEEEDWESEDEKCDGTGDGDSGGGGGVSRKSRSSTHAVPGLKGSIGSGSAVIRDKGKAKRRRLKSWFPVYACLDNKGRAAVLQDLLLLTRLVCQESTAAVKGGRKAREDGDDKREENVTADTAHLGLYTDRRGASLLLQQEVRHHLSHDNMDYALQMELWKGNISGAIQLARERQQLSDWIVSLAPLASHETWLAVCEEYAEQLEEEGQYHKAVSYLLAAHRLYPAIHLFRRHKLYKEAVSLARVRLSPLDPLLEDLYLEWTDQLMRDGAYEHAAKCYLAMKRVLDAAQVIARRSDQSALQTSCYMTLTASERQQGQLYAQQAVTRYLLTQQWTDCIAFLKKHTALKVFLPYVSVHELLVKELRSLLPEIIPAHGGVVASCCDNIPGDKPEIPEFILDPKESDSVLPWEPYLVAGHTFPHHVLRVWHLHLGVTMETEHMQLIYQSLQQLQSGRQTHLDIPQVLLQVCVDVTMWLLALLTNQTSLSISHLLGALSTLHDGGHHQLLTALCRLLLPQGPKYMVKLEQEMMALRVIIRMDSARHDMAGGGAGTKGLSLHRYLTPFKEECSVSMGAMRCKQLDCVRAYYYLSILHHLHQPSSACSKEVGPCAEVDAAAKLLTAHNVSSPVTSALPFDIPESEQNKHVSPNHQFSASSEASGLGERVEGQSSMVEETKASGCHDSFVVNGYGERSGAEVSNRQQKWPVDGDGGSSVDLPYPTDRPSAGTDTTSTLSVSVPNVVVSHTTPAEGSEVLAGEDGLLPVAKPSDGPVTEAGSHPCVALCCAGACRVNKSTSCWQLGLSSLLQLSKGLLWDVQAKRLALTDTLGHIHHAISQLLLTDPSREVARALSRHHSQPHNHHSLDSQPLLCAPAMADTVAAVLPMDTLLDIDDSAVGPSQASNKVTTMSGPAGEAFGSSSSQTLLGVKQDTAACDTKLPHLQVSSAAIELPSTSSQSASPVVKAMLAAGKSCTDASSLPQLEAQDPQSNLDLDILAVGQPQDGSRRVLWQDDPMVPSQGQQFEGRGSVDNSLHKPTSLLSPGKYINVPDEWYSLPVDEKYVQSYVTMAILKEEQDFVMAELKRISDSAQMPFPNPWESVEQLVAVCLAGPALCPIDKHNYIKGLQSWATHFAVTSQQRSRIEALFYRADMEIKL